MRKLLLLFIFPLIGNVYSQQETKDSTSTTNWLESGKLDFTMYVDCYYGYDFNRPYDGQRPEFLYQYTRDNEFNINRAAIDFSYNSEHMEARLGFNVGTFPNEFMGGKDTLYRYLYEANVKFIPNDKFDFTIGMFGPHFGYESGLSFDNMTVSQSLVSEATPYYLMGVKMYYHFTEHFDIGFTVANGWQNIYKNPGARGNGYGLQLNYSKDKNYELNYSNYLYNDSRDNPYSLYQEMYAKKWLGDKVILLSGISYGLVSSNNEQFNNSVGIFTMMGQYKISEKVCLGARYEHVEDGSGSYLILPRTDYGLYVDGASLNIDWSPVKPIKFRLETRLFSSQDKIFRDDRDFDDNNPLDISYSNVSPNILASVQVKIH